MNAMAVPPPGFFRHSDTAQALSRRNVRQGLALSALVHASALALFLWVRAQAPTEEVRLYRTPFLVDFPAPKTPPPLVVTGGAPPVVAKSGELVLRDLRDIDQPRLPDFDPRSLITGVAGPTTGPAGPAGPPVGEGPRAAVLADPDPPEGAFVSFDEPPVPVTRPDPAYPEWARENRIEGRVVLHALIGVDGRVRRVTVIRGVPGLTESAQEALYRWTFRPARMNRQPVAVWIEVPFQFRL